jgi:hypothetical protein
MAWSDTRRELTDIHQSASSVAAIGYRSHVRIMNLDLTDDETALLLKS